MLAAPTRSSPESTRPGRDVPARLPVGPGCPAEYAALQKKPTLWTGPT